MSSYFFAWVAGVLSLLSPCVLPIVPVLVASALNAHKRGLWALALGLALSFTIMGLFVATIGASIGLSDVLMRNIGAVLLVILGIVLWSSWLQSGFVRLMSRFGQTGHNALDGVKADGLWGQLLVGLLMGVVWSPCVGPTLGAAIALASQGVNLGQAALTMLLFGLGAAMPLLLLGSVSRPLMMRMRGKMLQAGNLGKHIFGGVMVLLGVMILLGWDKALEIWVLKQSPEWLINLTTRF